MGELGQSKQGQKETDKSNVDSEDMKYRKEILNTITVEQRRWDEMQVWRESKGNLGTQRERSGEQVKGD